MAFGIALLFVAIAAGRATHTWSKAMLVVLEVVVEGVVLVLLFGEVWFLAKTVMAVGMGAAGALIVAIVVGLALIAPAVWLVWLLVANCMHWLDIKDSSARTSADHCGSRGATRGGREISRSS